jgi:hypothetical protein
MLRRDSRPCERCSGRASRQTAPTPHPLCDPADSTHGTASGRKFCLEAGSEQARHHQHRRGIHCHPSFLHMRWDWYGRGTNPRRAARSHHTRGTGSPRVLPATRRQGAVTPSPSLSALHLVADQRSRRGKARRTGHERGPSVSDPGLGSVVPCHVSDPRLAKLPRHTRAPAGARAHLRAPSLSLTLSRGALSNI